MFITREDFHGDRASAAKVHAESSEETRFLCRPIKHVERLTSADGNTLSSAEEPRVELAGEADVGRCRSPENDQ